MKCEQVITVAAARPAGPATSGAGLGMPGQQQKVGQSCLLVHTSISFPTPPVWVGNGSWAGPVPGFLISDPVFGDKHFQFHLIIKLLN